MRSFRKGGAKNTGDRARRKRQERGAKDKGAATSHSAAVSGREKEEAERGKRI